MNEFLGPSGVTPPTSEEEYSKAPYFEGPAVSTGPLVKIFKVFGWLMLACAGLVLWVMGSFINDTLKGKQNQR